jgi:DNA-binding MarR family transcriptional regulator
MCYGNAVTANIQVAPQGAPAGSASAAVELLAALRTVVKGLERMPLPTDAKTRAEWSNAQPAPRHLAALMRVAADEGLSVSVLAEQLGVSLATASQVVTDLEGASLLERYGDPSDRRRTLLRVAESHRSTADALLATRLRPVTRALDRMRPAEQRALVRGLELVAEELSSVTSTGSV